MSTRDFDGSRSDLSFDPSKVNATEHYRQAHKRKQREVNLLTGLLVGLAAGLFWEAIRR